jgi:hypothetical protein
MGSTRFLKVARARSEEGHVVVKVFVKHDPTLPLEPHVEKIEKIKRDLAAAVNCLPFQKVMVNILSFIHWIFLNNLFIDQRASRSCGSRICQTLTIRSSFNSSIFDHH